MERTKVGEKRIGGTRFQQDCFHFLALCNQAHIKPQKFLRIWTALVITSGRTWPDITNMDASSRELTKFIQENRQNLDRVWRTILTTRNIRGFPVEREIRWKGAAISK